MIHQQNNIQDTRKALCNPLLKTHSETLICDASIEIQEANNCPLPSWSGNASVLSWLPNLNPRGGVKPCVQGSSSVWGLPGTEIRGPGRPEQGNPFSGLKIVSVWPACEPGGPVPPCQADLSLVHTCIDHPLCPALSLSLCLASCPD